MADTALGGEDGDSREDVDDGEWMLAASLPSLNPESKMEIVSVRSLTSEEAESARSANAFLARLANASSYARLADLYEQFEEARKAGVSSRRRAREMSRAAVALSQSARRYRDDLVTTASEDFAADPDLLDSLEAALSTEADQLPFKLLLAVAGVGEELFTAEVDDVTNSPGAIQALRGTTPGVGPATDFRLVFT